MTNSQRQRAGTRHLFGALLYPVIALSAGCGPAEENPTPAEPSPEEQRAADELVAAFCDGLSTCCSTQARTFDRAACERDARAEIEGRRPTGDHLQFDRAAVDACLASIRSTLPTCYGIELEACNRIYAGTLAEGQACDSTAQCAPVSGAVVTCFGTCKAGRRARESEACACTRTVLDNCAQLSGEPPFNPLDPNLSSWGECHQADGLACVGLRCVRGPGEGNACFGGAFCIPPLVCTDSDICAPPTPVGQPCADCGFAGYCDENGLCAALRPAGAACELDLECASDTCESAPTNSLDPICVTATTGAAHGTTAECAGDVHF
jgi:hypothetical protein